MVAVGPKVCVTTAFMERPRMAEQRESNPPKGAEKLLATSRKLPRRARRPQHVRQSCRKVAERLSKSCPGSKPIFDRNWPKPAKIGPTAPDATRTSTHATAAMRERVPSKLRRRRTPVARPRLCPCGARLAGKPHRHFLPWARPRLSSSLTSVKCVGQASAAPHAAGTSTPVSFQGVAAHVPT